MLLAGSTQAVRWGNGVVLKRKKNRTASLSTIECKAHCICYLSLGNILCDNSINLSQISTQLQTALTGTLQLWILKEIQDGKEEGEYTKKKRKKKTSSSYHSKTTHFKKPEGAYSFPLATYKTQNRLNTMH